MRPPRRTGTAFLLRSGKAWLSPGFSAKMEGDEHGAYVFAVQPDSNG